jgi:Ulp1 family protease
VWLNDEMINAYFQLLQEAYKSSLFFNTHFVAGLSSGLNPINFIPNKTPLLNYNKLLFPINIANVHSYINFYNDILDLNASTFTYYDSTITNDETEYRLIFDRVIEFIQVFTGHKLNVQYTLGQSSKQYDRNSCGVYMCYTGHRIAKNESIVIQPEDIWKYRLKMARNLALY